MQPSPISRANRRLLMDAITEGSPSAIAMVVDGLLDAISVSTPTPKSVGACLKALLAAPLGVADRKTLLDAACAYGQIELVKIFVASQPDLLGSIQPDGANHPIHWAASSGSVAVMELLISHGCDPNVVGGDGLTALHCALLNRKLPLAKLLCERGACLSTVDKRGRTPAQLVAGYHLSEPAEKGLGFSYEALELLVGHGADIDLSTPLCKSARALLLSNPECVGWPNRLDVHAKATMLDRATPISPMANRIRL